MDLFLVLPERTGASDYASFAFGVIVGIVLSNLWSLFWGHAA
jgi:hypothetical protein